MPVRVPRLDDQGRLILSSIPVQVPRALVSKSARRALRGVNVAGAEFTSAGTMLFDSAASFRFLAGRGHRLVRLPFLWESIQPTLSAPLDGTQLAALKAAVGNATAAGLSVILDVHNYGKFNGVAYGATGSFTLAHFTDLWRRLSLEFKDNAGVVGYGLMNEPRDLPTVGGVTGNDRWKLVQQAALDAIRATGDVTCVLVSGYNAASMGSWLSATNGQPTPYIVDPLNNFRWEAHHYWDAGTSGAYTSTYAAAVAAGFGSSQGDAARTAMVFYLNQWLTWLKDNNQRGYIGEFGWPSSENGDTPSDAAAWDSLAELYLSRLDQEDGDLAWFTAWATGDRWSDGYNLQFYESTTGVLSTPLSNAATLEKHLAGPTELTVAQKTQALSVSATALEAKADLVGGVIPSSQIPALALTSTVVVASQTAMLALTTSQVQPGDLAVRTDGAGTFILTATDPSVLANWTRLNAPTDAVVSVAGQTGTVVLTKSDVGLGSVDNTSDASKPVSTAQQTALNAKAPTASPTFTGTVTVPDSSFTIAKTTGLQTALDAKRLALLPSYVGTRTSGWDPEKSIYNTDSASLRNLRKAIAKAGASTCRIAFLGDSVTSAAGTNPGTDDPVTKLRQRLQGLGYTVGELVSLANRANGGNFQDSRITLAGTWGQAGTNFPYLYTSTNGSTLTYTSGVAGTVLEIVYGNGTGAFTYSIDGATAVTVTGTNTGSNATTTVTGLPNTTHTVVITLTGSVEVDFAAIGVRSTTGVVLITQGIGGSGTTDWAADTSWFRPLGVTAAMSPDVVVIELGLNDGYYGTVPVATFKANLATIISYWVTAGVTPLLTASHVLGGTYVSGIYDEADAYDLPLLDLRDRIGGDTTTTASITGDGVHFNAQGYHIKARAWADLLALHTPVALADPATTYHVSPLTVVPRLGQFGQPPGMSSSSSGAVVNQRATYTPFFVGPQGWTFDAFRILVATAAVGGAGLSFNTALYKDDGTGWPNPAQQVAVGNSADFVLISTGQKTSVLGTPVVLAPGLYWQATLYQYTTVPTTAPQVACISGCSWALPITNGLNVGTVPRGIALSSQTALPTTGTLNPALTTYSAATDCPVVALRRSA